MAKKAKGRHFVPVEDLPGDGLTMGGREVLALLVIGFCLYGLLSLATYRMPEPVPDPFLSPQIPRGGMANLGGTFGHYLAKGLLFVLGLASWALFLFGVGYGMVLFTGRVVERLTLKALGTVVFTAMLALLFAGATGDAGTSALAPYGAGGRFGGNLSPRLQETFGGPGRILLLVFGGLASLLVVTECLFSTLLERAARGVEGAFARLRPALAGGPSLDEEEEGDDAPRRRAARPPAAAIEEEGEEEDGEEIDEEEEEEEEPDEEGGEEEPDEEGGEEHVAGPEESAPEPEKPRARPRRRKPVVRRHRARPSRQQNLPFDAAYPFPPIDLFQEADETDPRATDSVLQQNSEAIVQRLSSFKIDSEVVGVSLGPAVTQYELRLGHGVRVGRITSFEADLAAALRAVSVRVVAPIPGKDTVGVEVPNQQRQMVFLRELLEQYGRSPEHAIPLFLGKDVAGCPIVEDLARMPHLLIAGTTGSGKSVCINSILLSVLMTRTPQDVRLILVDPKMVELQAYEAAPHLCCDVVTNMKKAPSVLEWAVEEMEKRYALLSAAGTNHIRSYNKLGAEQLEKRMGRAPDPDRTQLPYIVIVIDELADLMAAAAKEVEESIQRLAQKSRAVGMHVILATQRPSTDVITGIIKANLPCQIAFKVNRKIDSRVILDINGAEKLLGHGDMLYVPPGGGAVVRAQGTFVGEDELHKVMEFLAECGPRPDYLPELVQSQTGRRRGPEDRDEMYGRAVEVVLGQQRGSATLLQRALAVGYTRATRLLEMMEEDGVVGPFVGSKSREVLLTLEEWREREEAAAAELAALEDGDFEEEGQEAGGEEEDGAGDDGDPTWEDEEETDGGGEERP